MSFIHKTILDNVNSYKTFLEQNINEVINLGINTANMNLFCTGEYKLFSIITENVRMDLNYLLSLNPDFDILGFPALKRNIRISIETYYDLFNLVVDDTYMKLLEFQAAKINHIDNSIKSSYMPFLSRKKLDINKRPLTISEKANIAKSKNNLNCQIYTHFKQMATDANSYIHPNIFIGTNVNRDAVLKLLIFCDCQLLMYAFELLNNFITKCQAPYISTINPLMEYNKLYNAIASVPWIYQ